MTPETPPFLPPQEVHVHLTHSHEIGKLAGALAKAQGSFETVTKDAKNPFFKSRYADLATVISATSKALSANDLAFIQSPGNVTGKSLTLTSILAHSSGEWIRGELEMPLKEATAQGVGSAITYARRYAAQAILNVAGEDDDGNAATRGSSDKEESNEEFDQRTEGQRVILPHQATAIWDACKRSKKSNEEISAELKKYGVVQIEQLMRNDFQPFLKWANNIGENLQMALDKSVKEAPSSKASVAMKAVFAMAGKKGIPEVDVKRWCYETYGVESMTHLTSDQLGGALEWLKSVQ